ncbi:hypothetical protein [uncultured Bacteroides sp.]|uniref:hypothetical protein n=1 Tax=uncultured Bacteroides sp. TaxID=162156 RepID=UPI002606E195|nr:hypothetical protein [uncultured Bacteroides sp.]
MRKWTYLVAALLMSGTAATFTSCIDTTEPAGIEEMRSAKAELLKAKAAVQTALAAKEQARAEGIKLENAGLEIDNQIAALNLELQQAINEWKKDSIQAERDSLAVSLETLLLKLNKQKAEADYKLQEALEKININLITMKDDMYARELSYYKALLVGGPYIKEDGTIGNMTGTGAQTQLAIEQNSLLSLKMLQIAFEAEKENYKATLETRKAEQEAVLKIHQSLLESVQAIKDASTDNAAEIAEKIAAKKNELRALDTEESDKIKQIQEAADALLPAVNETNKEREKLEKKEIYTIKKTDELVKIANELYTAVNRTGNSYFILDAFQYNSTTGEYELTGDIESKALNMLNRKNGISSLANEVMQKYYFDFENAYFTIIGTALSSYPFNEDGSVKEEYLSKINNELERWAIDAEQVEKAYKADEKAWLDAYGAYMAALYTYTNYKNGQNYYDATSKAIEEYKKSTDKTLAKANELRTLVRTYIANREKVDGAVSTASGTFYDNYKDALTDANKAQFDSEIQDLDLGTPTISTTYNSNGSNENNLLDKFIEATRTFLGSNASTLAMCKEPMKVVNGDETTYVVPEGLEPVGESNFETYLNNQKTISVIDNIDTWVALYQTLDKDAQTLTDTYNEINATINAANTASLDKLETLWKLEVEGFLIKGTNSTDIWVSSTLSNDYRNPYYSIYASGSYLTKAQVIRDEINALENIQSGNTIDYVYYVEYNNKYEVRTGTIDNAIKAIEAQIEAKEGQLITTNTLIKLFEEQGFISENWNPEEYPTDNNCGAVLENSIKAQEDVVKLYEAEVARIEAIINNLLAAMSGE